MAENEGSGGFKFDVGALMKRKVLGVPVAVIALIFAGALLYMALRMRGVEPEDEELEDEPDGDPVDAGFGTPIFTANALPPSGAVGDTIATPEQDEDTDQAWSSRAITWLIGQGESVTVATGAITGYLQGETLSQKEGELRDKAIVKFGAPPESGFQPTKTKPYKGPSDKNGEPPTRHTVKGKNDDTFGELARLYYRRDDVYTTRYLRAANNSLAKRHKGRLPVGTQVIIPKYQSPKYFRATNRVNGVGEIARANGVTVSDLRILNPGINWPAKSGRRVRVQ